MQDFTGAIKDCDIVIEASSDSRAALVTRAVAFQRLGKNAEALADYEKAIALDPKDSLPYKNRGTIKEAEGDFSGALADYKKAIEGEPNNLVLKNAIAGLSTRVK
jgi:tetratricopeptide (TPR) repeat protein